MSEKDEELNNKPNGENSSIEKSAHNESAGSDEAVVENNAAGQPEANAESRAAVQKPRKKKANIFWNIFLVVVIAIGILSLFGIVREIDPESGASFGEVMRGADSAFFVILILIVLLTMVLDVSKFCIISKTVTGKVSFATSAKTNFLGRYYDAVTPFSTGGQPMQVYYLSTKGISGGNATAMVLIRYFSSIICWITLGGALMIAGAVQGVLNDVKGGDLLKITGWIGIAINLIVPAFVTLFLLLPKFMYKLTAGVVKLGYKMKIVKDVEKTTERATKVVTDFKNSFKLMATSPLKLILLLLVCTVESACTFAIPFFVMKAFSCPNVDGMLLSVMALNAYATFGVSFIPTPGNSGVVEGLGALAFSAAAGAALAWSVLTWRLAVFYVYIFIGIGITIYDVVAKNVKYKKQLKGRK